MEKLHIISTDLLPTEVKSFIQNRINEVKAMTKLEYLSFCYKIEKDSFGDNLYVYTLEWNIEQYHRNFDIFKSVFLFGPCEFQI